ncbi:hypothetical protein EBB07_22640 [Paenibacillaceae bacterium]|nr:hypothetical protein EBB07_22640 [Paenibacillaceae bacterium]
MYDYVSIYSDETYSGKIRAKVMDDYLTSVLKFTRDSNLKFSKEIRGEVVTVTGIPTDSQGSYAFDSLEGIEEINLIEIDIPMNSNYELEQEILAIANAIARQFSWTIDLRE